MDKTETMIDIPDKTTMIDIQDETTSMKAASDKATKTTQEDKRGKDRGIIQIDLTGMKEDHSLEIRGIMIDREVEVITGIETTIIDGKFLFSYFSKHFKHNFFGQNFYFLICYF